MKTIIASLLTLIMVFSCKEDKKSEGYELNGSLKNIPDSSVVYISVKNVNIDSTLVLNQKFKFTGTVNHPKNVYLLIKNTKNYASFWLENSTINFTAEDGKFRDAQIEGSQVQKEDDLLDERLETVKQKIQNIENSFNDSMSKSEVDSITKRFNALQEQETTIYQNFIAEFPNSLVSSYLLDIYASTWGKEKSQALFNRFSKTNKNSEYGRSISDFIKFNKEPKLNDQFVDFEMEDQNGQKIRLSDGKGRVVLLEFWASWCGPCREENPELVKTYQEFKHKGFEIVAVSLDVKRENWMSAIHNDSLSWIHVSDLKGDSNRAALIYGVNGIPDNFLIDENGVIIGRDLRGAELRKKLKDILDSKS